MFTTVHLFALYFSVILALDGNLYEIDESDEPRLSEEKEKAIFKLNFFQINSDLMLIDQREPLFPIPSTMRRTREPTNPRM